MTTTPPTQVSFPNRAEPLAERGTGLASEAWYRFFETLRTRAGGDVDAIAHLLDELTDYAATAHNWTAIQAFTVAPTFGDVANQLAARNNLGLGTAATQNTGAAGHNLPFLDIANTWAAAQQINANLRVIGGTIYTSLTIQSGSAGVGTGGNLQLVNDAGVNKYLVGFSSAAGAVNFLIYDLIAAATRFTILSTGNVGIGTPTPGSALEVAGDITVNIAAGGGFFHATGASGNNRGLLIETGGLARFRIRGSTTAEAGANSGTNFAVDRFDDTGTLLATCFSINRATGAWSINGNFVINAGFGLVTAATTVAALPGAPVAGQRAFVTDATVTLTAGIGTVVAGGGANGVPLTWDGAAWRIG